MQRVGAKWNSLWDYINVRNFQAVATEKYPTDVWRLSEDKVMEVLPWVEQVHIHDPEGTDIRFSITAKDAEVWAKGAYQPSHLFMNPLQGTRNIYFNYGLHDVVVPRINGVVAGTGGGSLYKKIYIEDGLVSRVEGGGRLKEVWDAYLSNPELANVQVPHFPNKGFLWCYEFSFGSNPKARGNGRAGSFHWGFGIETGNPEIVQYLKERNLPNDHWDQMNTLFTTYEIKLRGKDRWVKIVEKGHLSALDNPEVRALASRYGDVDEILQERYVPGIPGINVPGDYFRDYAKNPAAYNKLVRQQIQDGTYPYLR